MAALGVWAQEAVAPAPAVETPAAVPSTPTPKAPVEPGYRAIEATELKFNPFEPVTDVRSDPNSAAAQAMLKRIKGYVVQPNGSPLLVIDGKSYRIRDKVPMNAPAKKDDKAAAEPLPADAAQLEQQTQETATILNITPSEAVFQKDDPSGFGGETFKIFFNFKHETDEQGKTNYNVWEAAGTGFFINEDGIAVVPLALAQSAELSVLTPYGYSRATLVETDNRRGIALLKVNIKSIPLFLAEGRPAVGDAVFPAGYSTGEGPGQKPTLKFLEGFVKENTPTGLKLSPEVDGSFLGSAVLNNKAEVIGVMVGDTQRIAGVVALSASDGIFRKYAPTQTDPARLKATRATIEQSVVKIYKKK